MSFRTCCNPLKTTAHGQDWMASVNVEQMSSGFLAEYKEFIPKNCNPGELCCNK